MQIIGNKWIVFPIFVLCALSLLYLFPSPLDSVILLLLFVNLAIFLLKKQEGFVHNLISRFLYPIIFSFIILAAYKASAHQNYFEPLAIAKFQGSTPFAAFIQIVSTLYAVSIAFLLLKGIQDHEKLSELLRKKASSSLSISDYLYYFQANPNDAGVMPEAKSTIQNNMANIVEIRKKLIAYLEEFQLVVENELSEKYNNEITSKQRELREAISELEPVDKNDEYALQEIIQSSNELSNQFGQITSNIRSKMSGILIFFIFLVMIICIVSFFDGNYCPQSPLVVIIFAMSFLFMFIFMLILDMNDPFSGKWKIDTTNMDEAILYLKKSGLTLKL